MDASTVNLAPLPPAVWLGACAALGFGLGWAYFALLRWNTALYLRGRRRGLALVLQLLRFAVLALVLWQLARVSAWALLAAFAGFLVARVLALRGARA